MSVFVGPFKRDDLDGLEPIEPGVRGKRLGPEMAQAIEDSGLAVTALRDGKIFLCGGVHPIDDFHGELWLRLGQACLKHKLDTLRLIREGLKIIEEVYPFKQLNAAIRCDFAPSIKMIKWLGFHLTQTRTYKGKKWLMFSKRVKE